MPNQFVLRMSITGLCILAYDETNLYVIMPNIPAKVDIPAHHAQLMYDLGYTTAGGTLGNQYGQTSFDQQYATIAGDPSDSLLPSIPKAVLDLTDTFSALALADWLDTTTPVVKAFFKISTGSATGTCRGNHFDVKAGDPSRYLGWVVHWETMVTGNSIVIKGKPLGTQAPVSSVELFPQKATRLVELGIAHRPSGMGTEPGVGDQIPHFHVYYDLFGIGEQVPILRAKDQVGCECPPLGLPTGVTPLNDAFTCIPVAGSF